MQLPFKHSIQVRLSLAFCLISLIAAIAAGVLAFYDTDDEIHDLQDDLLRQTAAYIDPTQPVPIIPESDNDAHISIQIHPTINGATLDGRYFTDGFHSILQDGDTYRVYVKNSDNAQIVVMQENEYREDLAERAAWNSAMPLLILLPFMMLTMTIVMYRTLRPVKRLSKHIELRDEDDLTPLQEQDIPNEVLGFVRAINHLLDRANAAMRQQQRFIADAAHELRSPMTALSVQADRLSERELPEPAKSQLESLRQGIQRNRKLLEQLLSLARAQASEAQNQRSKISIQQTFRHVLEDLLPLADEKNQDIGVVSTEDMSVYANELDIYTLVKTLVDNAIRYSPADSQIDLSMEQTSEFIIIRVEDNGPGIPVSERARVIDPFYRTLGTEQQGTGLGLSIATAIAKRYGGKVELSDSQHFKHGLLVSVWLNRKFIRE